MLEKQQHILPLDDLFEDEQIGAFVRSIQIDSPYQQLIFEGVLTETIKEERVMVTFTVEGYFHYVLGEVIEQQTEGKGAEALKQLLENNQLRGITEGVEQSLVRDVEKDDLARLMWLIDEGGKALDASAYPLAQAFLIHPIERVMDELLADPTDNDIEVLAKAIEKLESAQLNQKVSDIYKQINNQIKPDNIKKATLYVKSIKHIPKGERIKKLDRLNQLEMTIEDEQSGLFYFSLGEQYYFIAEYDKAIDYYEKSLAINLKVHGDQHPSTGISCNNLGSAWSNKGECDKAIDYYEKSLAIDLKVHGDQHPYTGRSYNNLGSVWGNKGEYDKAIDYLEKSLEIRLKVHGDQHPSTGNSYNNLGLVWSYKGEYNKAIDYLEKTLSILLKVNGDQHPSTGISYNNLGSAWSNKGEYDKAIDYYEKSLAIDLKVHGDQHPYTGTTHFQIGLLLKDQKNFKAALEHFTKGFISSPDAGGFPYNIGVCYEQLGNKEQALNNYLLSAEIRKKDLGLDHEATKTVISDAVHLAKELNKESELPDWVKKINNDQ
jgi:tetratricopeptide (TPR) repeat protein